MKEDTRVPLPLALALFLIVGLAMVLMWPFAKLLRD